MTTIGKLCLAILLGGTAVLAQTGATQPTPVENRPPTGVWVILLDDTNPVAFSHEWYRYGGAVTPNLDWLMKRGVLYPYGYVPHSTCRPALSTLHTGLPPEKHGATNNNRDVDIPSATAWGTAMKRLGYTTFLGGKWWEDTPPSEFGFDATEGVGLQQAVPHPFVRDGQDAFLAMIATDRPWFAVWAPGLPHSPFDAPQEYLDRINPSAIDVPSYVPVAQRAAYIQDQRRYLANLVRADDAVGEGLAVLATTGTLDSTLIVVCSDNGWDYGGVSKQSPYERGVRTPIVYYWPEKIPPRVDTSVAALIDIPPTVVGLCGGRPHPLWSFDTSASVLYTTPVRQSYASSAYVLRPLTGSSGSPPERTARWVRADQWKLIRWERSITPSMQPNLNWIYSYVPFPTRAAYTVELYNVWSDPLETTNVAGICPGVVGKLLTQLEASE